jgi:hypothetical protein
MAREVQFFSVTIPAGTPINAPQVTQMRMPTRLVTEIELRVPPGPRGTVGFRVGSSGTQVLPAQLGTWIVTDDEVIRWPLEGQHDSGSWEFTGYNTGQFPHTVTVRFLVDPVTTRPVGALAPIPADAISSAGDGFGVPPPIDLPPPPTLDLPPLPPPVELPPAPTLPGPGAIPGAAPATPQPVYNWWFDTMGRLLTYPDQTNTTRFDEILVMEDGSIGWYAFAGGAGMWQSYGSPAGSLGGNFVDVSAAFTQYNGKIRLNIVGTALDGRRWLKVMDPQNYTVITDWAEQPAAQSRELSYAKRVQGV